MPHQELSKLVQEQAALRRIATLVASGTELDGLVDAVTAEIGELFGAQRANLMRWTGDSIEVLGEWISDGNRGGHRMQYRCSVCGTLDDPITLAEQRLRETGRELIAAERRRFVP